MEKPQSRDHQKAHLSSGHPVEMRLREIALRLWRHSWGWPGKTTVLQPLELSPPWACPYSVLPADKGLPLAASLCGPLPGRENPRTPCSRSCARISRARTGPRRGSAGRGPTFPTSSISIRRPPSASPGRSIEPVDNSAGIRICRRSSISVSRRRDQAGARDSADGAGGALAADQTVQEGSSSAYGDESLGLRLWLEAANLMGPTACLRDLARPHLGGLVIGHVHHGEPA